MSTGVCCPSFCCRSWLSPQLLLGQVCFGRNSLFAGQSLQSGSCLISPNGVHMLAMQTDGNLVLSNLSTGSTEWASGTTGNAGASAQLLATGNLIISAPSGGTVWASNTAQAVDNFHVQILDEGNVVIYKLVKGDSNTLLYKSTWASIIDVHITLSNGQLVASQDAATLSIGSGHILRWYNDTNEGIVIIFTNGTPFPADLNPYSICAGQYRSSGPIAVAAGTAWSYNVIADSGAVLDPEVIIQS